MIDHELKDICKKLRPLIGQKADSLWLAYTTSENLKIRQEAEALIYMFAARHLARNVNKQAIMLPPVEAKEAAGEFKLGTVQYANRSLFPVGLNRDNFIRHIGILAMTGSGKTNVAQNMLLDLLEKDIPFLVIDWKRSYRQIKSLDNPKVNKIEVHSVGRESDTPFHWNPLRPPPGVHPRTWISIIAEVLEKTHISGPGVADIFIDLFDELFERYGFYDNQPVDKYPNFHDAKEILDKTQFRGRRMLWRDSCMRILKTFTFGPASRSFNTREPLKLEELLNKPVILELDFELPKPLRTFLSEIFLRFIHLCRLRQGETGQLRHVTFLEEVHNLFPKTYTENQATNSLESLFREIRGFGEGLVYITQHPSLTPIYLTGNSNTLIILGLQNENDIIAAKRALFLEQGEEVYLDRLKVGEGIVKIKGRVSPCHVKFPLVPINSQLPEPQNFLSQLFKSIKLPKTILP
ncbi:MAG: ATP-binding protein [Victivallaceae bacterium]|nr:ATP-binding protein [Victivallaceae bacterium]